MQLETVSERINFKDKLNNIGVDTSDGYWKTDKVFSFTKEEVLGIEDATAELNDMILNAVDHVVKNNLYHLFKIDKRFHNLITKSWQRKDTRLCARLDFGFNPNTGEIKLFECNATPTLLIESAIAQSMRMKDSDFNFAQFNSIEEALLKRFSLLKKEHGVDTLYLSCMDNPDDYAHTMYMLSCAEKCGINAIFLHVEDIGYDSETKKFVDLNDEIIENLYILYPYEWFFEDEYGKYLNNDILNVIIEPYWTIIAGSKAILPVLWELYPNHKYLLPSFFKDINNVLGMKFVEKPIYGRGGSNITLIDGNFVEKTEEDGDDGKYGYIYQQKFDIPSFDGVYPVIGSWIVGDTACGMGVRAGSSLITDNNTPFYSHYFISTDDSHLPN
jgi:glutathionylspermidine synthase